MEKRSKTEQILEKAKSLGCVPGLEAISCLMEEMGNVQEGLSVVHVAGTNGKGSTGAMLEEILCRAGFQVGRFTSPAVFFPEEVYQINQVPILKETYQELMEEIASACSRLKAQGKATPTLFEMETAVGFLWFYRMKCDIVILETGLGGRLDATNIIKKPLCSVITPVSMDHMAFLGNTLEQIAWEKAGIIKKGCPAVLARQTPEAFEVFQKRCQDMQAKLWHCQDTPPKEIHYEAGRLMFDWEDFPEISLSLLGAYQPQNAVCAILAARCLNDLGFEIKKEDIREGLAQARWPGRFEIVSKEPLMVIDGAHNEDAAKKLRETLEMGFTNRKIIYIIGVLADKDHEAMLRYLLPLAQKVYTITPENPRALSAEELCQEAKKYHRNVQAAGSISLAVRAAAKDARQEKESMVLGFGSLSWLGCAKEAIERENKA
ncbi:MAG: bifunctional folylpolyglutamate synthase/dihydrofolate synthase [Lachnospiraceae bacterium]|nr:bifunctional folylpolyglutamate synthase/dihydrofolate synthase [Lachnospiraceae bacterium]